MILLATLASAADLGNPHVALGNRFDSDGVGGAGGLVESIVLGGDGGTFGTVVAARYGNEKAIFSAYLPFASYRTTGSRGTHLGNLRVEGFYRTETEAAINLIGAEIHLPTGRAWTWTNDAVSYWQSAGVTFVYQRRQRIDSTDVLLRGSLGLHSTPGYAPVPRIYPHVLLAVGVDRQVIDRIGVTGEISFSAWDPSPFDVGGWARLEPLDGLELRVGGIAPLGTWLGASPSNKPGGLREATLSLSLSVSP